MEKGFSLAPGYNNLHIGLDDNDGKILGQKAMELFEETLNLTFAFDDSITIVPGIVKPM